MDGHIMRCGIIGSCQSAATSEIVERCSLLVTNLSGAIASIHDTFTFTFFTELCHSRLHDTAIITSRDIVYAVRRRGSYSRDGRFYFTTYDARCRDND